MLTEQRYEIILKLLEEKNSITVAEVKDLLNTSESTVRRDITALHNAGKLVKVFGGAVACDRTVITHEPTVEQKAEVNVEAKQLVAAKAAALIQPEDFVYLDAGTTTACMLSFLTEKSAIFVTNAVAHAKTLAAAGFRVYLVGGSTEAVVGNQALMNLQSYHFTKGFFGTNGISRQSGLTTPDMNEAMVKKTAMGQCRECFILADHSKFGNVSSVTFGAFQSGTILTDDCPEEYKSSGNVVICG
jgi:DeoR family fructose operon transcriptional repressor